MRLMISILLSLMCIFTFARTPKEAMERLKVHNVPFNGTLSNSLDINLASFIEVDDGILSHKVYSNAQLTEWLDMKKYTDFGYYCRIQFDNPSHNNNYLLISLNDAGDFWTDIMASVDSDGNIMDYIDACITSDSKFGIANIMQYRIAANGDVIISRIVPTSTTSTPLGDLKDFHGYRQDTTYRLDQNGKFHIVDVVKYVPQLYMAQMMADNNYHVWNGNETPAE